MRTINDLIPTKFDIENSNYNYQTELTSKLDSLNCDFSQELINEIVLWKVNRYACLETETLNLINQIKKDDIELNPELTGEILMKLLGKEQKGVRLAMASTILKFKNPKVYQIIDQRVYRFLYGEEFKYSEGDVKHQITIYLDYLSELRQVCNKHNVNFEYADRIFYTMDKTYNGEIKLNGY